ncbi:MAG TPA: hypothetical protein VGE26_07640 [Sphingobacteriaceae bacterium]
MITKAPLYLRIAALPFIGGFLYYYFTQGPNLIAQASLAGAFLFILTARIIDFLNRKKAGRRS